MDWLKFIRDEKNKRFTEAKLVCRFPEEKLFEKGFDYEELRRLCPLEIISADNPEDGPGDVLPSFSVDPDSALKQAVALVVLRYKLDMYERFLGRTYGMLSTQLINELYKEVSAKTVDHFKCVDIVNKLRDYITAVIGRERREEEIMDNRRIESELKEMEKPE